MRTPAEIRADVDALRNTLAEATRADGAMLSGGEDRPAVLIADGDTDMREYIRHVLTAWYDVRGVADGEEALAALQHGELPDLLMTEMVMPRLDGIGLLRAVRADPAMADVPVILMADRASDEVDVESSQTAAVDYLMKPFSARELVARVAANIEMARLRSDFRRTTETASFVKERLLMALIASGTGTFRWDIATNMIEGDAALNHLFGFPPEAANRSLDEYLPRVHPNGRQQLLDDLERCKRDAVGFELEYQIVRPDGTVRWIHDRGKTFRDALGRPSYMTGACVDITERKHGDQARLYLAAIVESSHDAIIGKTLDGIVTSWNRGAEEIFGYASDEILGRSIVTLIPIDRFHEEEEIIAKISRNEKVSQFDTVRRRKDGAEINVSLTVSPIRDPDGKIIGASKIARDLTSRQNAERHLKEVQGTLVHVSRLSELEQMGSALSHELNQPLTAIANYVETGRRWVELQNPAKAIQNLEKAVAQVNRTGEIIRRLRQFVQKGSSERRRESINDVIEEATALALIGAMQQGIRTIFQLESSVPHSIIDKVQIQQVIVNLIRNSIEAMVGADQRLLTVGTSLIAEAFVEISISDTGSGLSEEIKAKLFQPFVSTKSQGMGIGLSISRSIVRAHGGDLRAEQNSELGATFRFTLPLGN